MLTPPDSIVGAKIRLRRSTPGDAKAVFQAASDPDVMRFMDWPAHKSVADAEAYMNGCADRWASGLEYHWVIESRAGGPLLGCIACRIRSHAADFGYFLARSAWGQGVATEAVSLMVGWLGRQPSILRIWATTDVENIRSAKVLERAGLQLEGVLRMATYRPNLGGLPRDTAVYAICKPDLTLPSRGSALSDRKLYDDFADKIGLVPNVRLKDNLMQGLVVAAFTLIGALVGVFAASDTARLTGAGFGAFAGLIIGGFLSGFILMIRGLLRK